LRFDVVSSVQDTEGGPFGDGGPPVSRRLRQTIGKT